MDTGPAIGSNAFASRQQKAASNHADVTVSADNRLKIGDSPGRSGIHTPDDIESWAAVSIETADRVDADAALECRDNRAVFGYSLGGRNASDSQCKQRHKSYAKSIPTPAPVGRVAVVVHVIVVLFLNPFFYV